MSEVTICNVALSHLGDTATVMSIKPPDSSVQAQLCSRFYYVARNALLEMATWGFATRRVRLAEVQAEQCGPRTWRHTYALPAAVLNAIAVLPKDAPNDYEARFGQIRDNHFPPFAEGYDPLPGPALYTTQPFAIETLTDGTQVVLTDQCEAVLRYSTVVEDTTKFSPLFVLALSHLLASMLAGPILKGEVGMAAAEKQLELFNVFKGQATSSDANQRKTHVEPVVGWIRGR